MSNLLVVDFDSFFPNPLQAGDLDNSHIGLYDWSHAETPFMIGNILWVTRAASFLSWDRPLPTVQPPAGGWTAFWDRFTFTSGAMMLYADSNMHAGRLRPGLRAGKPWKSVVLFDAHHDSGYSVATMQQWLERKDQTFSCDDWMLVHQQAGCHDLTVRYPQWRPIASDRPVPEGVLTKQVADDGLPLATKFDMVFVCRSGAWVPPWCDQDFLDFIDACPIDGVHIEMGSLDRKFPYAEAEQEALRMKEFRDQVTANNLGGD